MKPSSILAIAAVALPVACSSGSTPSGPSKSTPELPIDAGVDGADGGNGTPGPWDGSAIATIAMARISRGAPAFASGSSGGSLPGNANDDDPMTSWASNKLPAWIAYDLSQVPAAQRQSILVVWNAEHAGAYLNPSPPPAGNEMPTDYVLEINAASGGTPSPPTDGWVRVAAVSTNVRNTMEHPVDLAGGNWVRMSITGSTDPNLVAIDLDVFSTPNGATDCWMLMGDSITNITMGYAFSNLPQLVHQARNDRWPAIINAAIGGTSTATAVSVIDQTLSGYPGRYVALAYGTNDHANTFQMEALVQKVLAAGKIPVVPLMPWSDVSMSQTNGPQINQAITALYTKYPQIVHGPDLWAAFMNRTDLIPSGDVHPNAAGQAFLRQQWASVMVALP